MKILERTHQVLTQRNNLILVLALITSFAEAGPIDVVYVNRDPLNNEQSFVEKMIKTVKSDDFDMFLSMFDRKYTLVKFQYAMDEFKENIHIDQDSQRLTNREITLLEQYFFSIKNILLGKSSIPNNLPLEPMIRIFFINNDSFSFTVSYSGIPDLESVSMQVEKERIVRIERFYYEYSEGVPLFLLVGSLPNLLTLKDNTPVYRNEDSQVPYSYLPANTLFFLTNHVYYPNDRVKLILDNGDQLFLNSDDMAYVPSSVDYFIRMLFECKDAGIEDAFRVTLEGSITVYTAPNSLELEQRLFSKNEIYYRSETAMRINEDEIVTWIMIIDDRGMEIGWCKAEDLSLK